MSTWIAVTASEALPEGAREIVGLEDGRQVLLARVAGELVAVEDRCSHEDLPLSDGDIEGSEIVCPYHGARFCLKTGEATAAPAYDPITVFPVRVNAGVVEIDSAV